MSALEPIGTGVPLIVARRFDPSDAQVLEMREGLSVLEMIRPTLVEATPEQRRDAMVMIITAEREILVPREAWATTHAPAGSSVRLYWPLLGRSVLRAVLMIAVIAAAAFLGPLAAGALGFSTTGAAAGLLTGLIGGLGQALVNALVPIKPPKPESGEQNYQISTIRNEIRPYEVVPDIHGRIRHYPPMLALPFTEKLGEDVYFRCLFLDGLAGFTKSDYRIGDTPLSEYADVDIEELTLQPGDAPSKLFPFCVFEDQLNIQLSEVDGWATQDTASNVNEINIDWTFDGGLNRRGKKGRKSEDVTFEYRIKRRDPPGLDYVTYPEIYVEDETDEAFHVMRRHAMGAPGRFRVQTRRISEDETDGQSSDKIRWSALRGFRPVFTSKFDVPVQITAMRIRASRRLSGMVETFNYLAQSVRRDWDQAANAYIVRETQNPASHFIHILQGPGNGFPATDQEINWSAIQEWSEWCRQKNLKCNLVHDKKQSLNEALKDVCRAGRALPTREDGKWSVAIDRPQTVVRGHVTARNATLFAGDPGYRDPVYGIRAKFLDETDDFKQTERFVRNPKGGGDPKDVLVREYPGETHPDQVWRSVMRDFATIDLRWEPLHASQGWQEKLAPRGSLVILQIPFVTDVKSARVRAVAGGLVVLDETVWMTDGERYGCRFQVNGGEDLVREIVCQPGGTMAVRPLGEGQLPEPGDLAVFGPFEEIGREVIVVSKERQPGLRARITFHDHAPEIEAAADAGPPPEWFPITPDVDPFAGRKPAPPVITSVTSSVPIDDDDDGVIDDEPVVVVRLRPGDDVTVDTYDFEIDGDEQSRSAATGRASFLGYDVGDTISVKARSRPYGSGEPSEWSASVPHTVRASDDPPPDVVSAMVLRLSDGKRRFEVTLDPAATAVQVDDVVGYRIYARPGAWSSLGDLSPIHSGLVTAMPFETSAPLTTGLHTFAVIAVDPLGQISNTPFLWQASIGPSYGPQMLAQRLEAALGWPGTITGATVVEGALQGGLSLPSALSYKTPVVDIGNNRNVVVAATAYGAAGDVTLSMRTGRAVDGGPIGAAVPLGAVTARYVEIFITVSNSSARARLGELVTFITPA